MSKTFRRMSVKFPSYLFNQHGNLYTCDTFLFNSRKSIVDDSVIIRELIRKFHGDTRRRFSRTNAFKAYKVKKGFEEFKKELESIKKYGFDEMDDYDYYEYEMDDYDEYEVDEYDYYEDVIDDDYYDDWDEDENQ